MYFFYVCEFPPTYNTIQYKIRLNSLKRRLSRYVYSLIYRYKWAFVGDAAAGCMDNNNLSSDFVPHITRIAKLMESKVRVKYN